MTGSTDSPATPVQVAGVVLAAGRSSRMGRPKTLLPVDDDTTFLERGIAILSSGGCEPVVAVLPAGEEARPARDLAARAGALVVENPDPDTEQVDSLLLGLAAMDAGPAAAVVQPVDHPLATASTVAALVASFREHGAPIVRPVHRGEPGHPVLFSRDLWREFARPGLEAGARDVVGRHHDAIEDVEIDDRGVTVDVDTPEEYESEVE